MVQIPCPNCGKILNVPDEHLGMSGRCKHCHGHIVLRRPYYVAAIDFETTGLDANDNEVLEVAGVLFDAITGHAVDRFCELVCPSVPISKKASAVNGITRKMVKDCRPPSAVLFDFLVWISRANLLIAHNAPFEASYLVQAARRYRIPAPQAPMVDTLEWAREDITFVSDHKLGTLLAALEVDTVGLHRAAADTEGLRQVTMYLLRHSPDPPRDLKKRSLNHAKMAEQRSKLPQRRPTQSNDLATDRQRDYLRDLGATEAQLRGITKDEGSRLIQALKEETESRRELISAQKETAKAIRKQSESNSNCLTCLIIVLILLFTPVWLPIVLGILAIIGLS